MDPPSNFHQHQHSPFLSDLDVSAQGNDPASSSPFNPAFADFNTSASFEDSLSLAANPSVPTTPYTPSFAAQAGSYHNSPLGSDLGNEFPQHSPNPNTYTAGTEGDFGNIDISVYPPDFIGDDYDPSAYDAPDNSFLFRSDFIASLSEHTATPSQNHSQNQSSSPSLSTSSLGSNNPGVSVSVTPALDNPMAVYRSGSAHDHGSPASSNGDNDYSHHQQQGDAARSRGSSISSQPNDYHGSATYGMESVHLDASTNLNQTHSPSWSSNNQSQNVQSPPPQIFIPGQTPEITHTGTSPVPSPMPSKLPLPGDNNSILPPGGLSMNVNIVPATPISAGNTQGGTFQNMGMMNQDRTSASSTQPQGWSGQSNQQHQYSSQLRGTSPLPQLPQAPPPQYTFPPNAALTPPPSGGSSLSGNGGDTGNALSALQLSRDGSPEGGNGNVDGSGSYLVPISNPRTRSKSETAIRPQFWQGMSAGYDAHAQAQNQNQNQSLQQGSALQTADGSYGTQQQTQLPRLNTPHHMPASFGPPISGPTFDSGNLSSTGGGYSSNNFLSPEHALGGADLRRSRSDSQGHRRNALSADMTPIFADRSPGMGGVNSLYNPPGFNRQGSPFLPPGQSSGLDPSGGMGMMSAGGAHRRSVSHGGSSHGHSRSLSRERVSLQTSPYPSPHASPRVNTNEPLPDPYSFPPGSSSYGLGTPGASPGFDGSAPTVHVMSHDAQGRPTVQTQAPIQVVRQNVTTHATADASQRRRRTEANFVCPVPGCGSTFTRHFNLKGHLRSHNEERPFKCKWPGCDKGFARQHDCKRHEQLHLNIRPYTCNGCKRTFARMDALNRHLRSDAGTECQAQQPILTSDTPNNPALAGMNGSSNGNGSSMATLTLKDDPDSNWPSSSTAGVMV